MRHLAIFAIIACLAQASPASGGDDTIRESVVKVYATVRPPDPIRPWTKLPPDTVGGSGVVLDGKRILTNAHVVLHASEVQIQPDRSSEKLTASVVAVAPGIDLALLKVDDESFFETHRALAMESVLPRNRESVSVYGYPSGGSDLSITKGIVSRIDFGPYNFLTPGLKIQVDAAINPGNSGGPALVDDKMIGIAFSRLSKSDNIGYIIPTEEIELFLKDAGDGKYDGKPVLLDEVQPLENVALRAKHRLSKTTKGMLVNQPSGQDASYPLKRGDVITRIGDHAIDNNGKVQLEQGLLLPFHYLIQKLARNDLLGMTISREGKELNVEVPVGPDRDKWLTPYLKGAYPSYFVYGPLVLSEATDDYINIVHRLPGAAYNLSFQSNPLMTRFGDRPSFEGERLVVVAHPMFSNRIGQGYHNPFMQIVKSVNGVRIKNLQHLVEILRDTKDEFIEFRFEGNHTETLVFNRTEALKATEEVLEDNGIRQPCSDDIAPVWRRSGEVPSGKDAAR
jgi:S1-C subfamily serine protease